MQLFQLSSLLVNFNSSLFCLSITFNETLGGLFLRNILLMIKYSDKAERFGQE